MAVHAPITPAPAGAPTFAEVELHRFDALSADLSVLASVIDTGIDSTSDIHRENLMQAALLVLERATDKVDEIRTALAVVRDAEGH